MKKQIIYIDMDNVLVDFTSAFPHLSQQTMEVYGGRLDEVPGIFSLMEPMKGAIDSYRCLSEHYDVYILSTAPWKNPSAWSDKLLWVQKYLGDIAYKRLILTHHKDLNRGDYLIDDRKKNGASEFQGTLIPFGSEHFPDWDAVLKYFNTLLNNQPIPDIQNDGLFISRIYTDWSFNQDEHNNYKLVINREQHKISPSARVKICMEGHPVCLYGTVLQVDDDGIVIHTDESLDITEEYSIKQISAIIRPPSKNCG